jgi:hypothetical protein
MRLACVAVLLLIAGAAHGQGGYIKPGMTITPVIIGSMGWNTCRPTTPRRQTRPECTACCNDAVTIGTIPPGQLPQCLLRCNTLQPQ